MSPTDRKLLSHLLADAPRNWDKWGFDDEVGALNYLTGKEIELGVAAIRRHRPFALGAPLDELAAECAEDGQYDGLYAASPVRVSRGAGGALNPIFIKWVPLTRRL